MLIACLTLVAFIVAIFLTASTIAAICLLLTKSDVRSVALGTFTMPALICSSLIYWMMTMEVDDAPPGSVLIGSLVVLTVVTPIAFLASRLTVRFGLTVLRGMSANA